MGNAPYYGVKTTYITPAAWSFWLWTVIDLLLLGMNVFQFFGGSKPVTELIGWRFAIVGILNSIFVNLFVKSDYVLSFIFSILTALVVSHVYYDLKTKASPSSSSEPWANIIFIHLPFSLWHAYSIVLVILSLFSAFGVNKLAHLPGVGTKVSVVIALAWLSATSIGYALHSAKGDVAGAVVIAWFLAAIYDNQATPLIHWVALAAFIISLFAIVKVVVFHVRSPDQLVAGSDENERAPLIA